MPSDSLLEFVEEAGGRTHLRVEHDFGDGFVRLHTSEAERRQAAQDIQCSENIVLELLRNSRDAHASHVFLATCREANARRIVVVDDGDGIPSTMHAHVLEPRVTSKLDTSRKDSWGLHGRGMALFSIATNSTSAAVFASDVGLGCSIGVETDVSRLPEKTDQSSFPSFSLDESGMVNVRGPRNILRTACEFAIAERDSCSVYVGSPAEITATLYEYGTSTLSAIDRAFCEDESRLPLVKRLATASDSADLARIAASLGLGISSRTARRIIDGQIAVLEPLIDRITISKPGSRSKAKRPKVRSAHGCLHFADDDKASIAAAAKGAYADIADRYYLEPDVDPQVTLFHERLTISIPLVEKD